MVPDRLDRAKQIAAAALRQEPSVRASFIRNAAAGDAELELQATALLQQPDNVNTVAERVAASPAAGSFAAAGPISSAAGGLLKNRYRIERELSRGGFGAVYLAHDQQIHDK